MSRNQKESGKQNVRESGMENCMENVAEVNRCRWVKTGTSLFPLYAAYHDKEWGRPAHNDAFLYEMLFLECFQAGLSWICILKKRENFRKAFDGFDPKKIALYQEDKVEELLQDPGIIRNRAKIQAAVANTRVFLKIQEEYGSFDRYLWHFTGGKVVPEPNTLGYTRSQLSDEVSRDLYARGMRFVGSVTIYSYLQAVGVINAHGPECFLFPAADRD